MKNIVVLVSGGGTNLQALIDAQNRGEIINGKFHVISSKSNAYALTRAINNGIPTRVIQTKDYKDNISYSKAIHEALYEEYADVVVLAGFMTILDALAIKAYPNKIINVHPS